MIGDGARLSRPRTGLDLDMHGSFDGVKGQVLRAGAKSWSRVVAAPDFASWLELLVATFERGLVDHHSPRVWQYDTSSIHSEIVPGYPRKEEPFQRLP